VYLTSTSFSLILTDLFSKSDLSNTDTVIELVCTRPLLSVGDTRCHLWLPTSFSNTDLTSYPFSQIDTNPSLDSKTLDST